MDEACKQRGMSDPGTEAALSILLGRMRLLEQDHGPDDWPAVQMRDITALCDAIAAIREEPK